MVLSAFHIFSNVFKEFNIKQLFLDNTRHEKILPKLRYHFSPIKLNDV